MKKITFPPFLRPGDTVAIVSPSGRIEPHILTDACRRIETWGLQVAVGQHADGACGKYAGTVRQRLADLQQAMDHPQTRAILCSRGGYGVVHLLSHIDFTAFHRQPKWLIGFSDITALHNLFQSQGYASIHAPMARHLAQEPAGDPCSLLLRDLLLGQLPAYHCEPHRLNRPGTARGILRGGNLAVAYGLRGTPYDLPAEGTVLFLEDVGERPHAVERMLYNLKLGGVLEHLSGLIIGQFTEYTEDCSLGKELYDALADMLAGYDFPVCFDFPVGHVARNLPLVCGAEVAFNVGPQGTELRFIC